MADQTLSEYSFGGLDRKPVNVLRLLSELEGSYQLLKYMGFQEDMDAIDLMKKRYYKLYFQMSKQEKNNGI
tara:strand:- start:205 stop:417 length:213 start_codon:yes stop_codon:yes gene_type:complete